MTSQKRGSRADASLVPLYAVAAGVVFVTLEERVLSAWRDIIPEVATDHNIDTHLHLSSLASDASESGFLWSWW